MNLEKNIYLLQMIRNEVTKITLKNENDNFLLFYHFISVAKMAAARSPKIGPRDPLELQ